MAVLETNKIRKEFGTLVAVNDINLTVEKGQVWGLIGPNGAGKTTLLRILATVLKPTCGNATILDNDLTSDYLKIRRHIGFMPDFFNLYNDLKLWECLDFFARAYNVKSREIQGKIDEVLQFVDLHDKRNSYIRHLSRGMVQRMGVAVLLVHSPDIFLLDEPASGLDPKARIQLRQVLTRLSDEGKTVLISSHILTELSGFCSHVAIMDHGNIVTAGAVDDIQKKLSDRRKVVITIIDRSQEAFEFINDHASTENVFRDQNKITLEISGSEENIAQLNTDLVNNGIKVSGIYEEKADLEDLFMQLTVKNNSDSAGGTNAE